MLQMHAMTSLRASQLQLLGKIQFDKPAMLVVISLVCSGRGPSPLSHTIKFRKGWQGWIIRAVSHQDTLSVPVLTVPAWVLENWLCYDTLHFYAVKNTGKALSSLKGNLYLQKAYIYDAASLP